MPRSPRSWRRADLNRILRIPYAERRDSDFHSDDSPWFVTVAANPYFEFYLRAIDISQPEFVWEKDGGAVYFFDRELTVA